MKKIKEKDMNVGDFIYLNPDVEGRRIKMSRYIIKVLLINSSKGDEIMWWRLKGNSFEPINFDGRWTFMSKEAWEIYNIYKLNEKEIVNFKKLLILHKLK